MVPHLTWGESLVPQFRRVVVRIPPRGTAWGGESRGSEGKEEGDLHVAAVVVQSLIVSC
jgi:hypothetical protein